MTALERVERALERLGPDPWNAFLHVEAEGARTRARRAPEGPLHGVVVSVKDNLAVRGMPMTCASRHLQGYVAPYTATVVERLEAAGAIVLGKTNLDEFACGSSGESSAFGPTLNPRDPSRVAGGSSSGAGASVAAGVVDLAVGSDTGGSVRAPGSFCGVAALKPSPGLVSRYGLSDLAMSLEAPAPMARTVGGLTRLMQVMAGPDPRDSLTAAASPFVPHQGELSLQGLRIGVPEAFFEGVEEATARPVRAALARLEAKGATLVGVELPSLRFALSAYYLLNYAEFASAMQRFDGTRYGYRGEGKGLEEAQAESRAVFGPEVKRRILLGTYVTSRDRREAWYGKALAAKQAVASDFQRVFEQVDVLAGPTMPFRAFRLGERVADPLAMYASDVLTVSANLAGVPAGTVPLRVEGLPVGFQVMGPRGSDARLLALMGHVEALSGVAP
ncbi:MAG TPA: amidase family protein [Candidatus Thermoplasmatota archaeon]|nr:amidase family protein [Candidatus Thermoplasmatota archaeon]